MIRDLAGALVALLSVLICGPAAPAEQFPFDQELLLDAQPMRPGKRMPILLVEANGSAKIDLWCKTVSARVEISGAAIKIDADPLPEALPEMLSAGQCTPDRVKADEGLLVDFTQVTAWQRQNGGIVLVGPTALKFRPSDH